MDAEFGERVAYGRDLVPGVPYRCQAFDSAGEIGREEPLDGGQPIGGNTARQLIDSLSRVRWHSRLLQSSHPNAISVGYNHDATLPQEQDCAERLRGLGYVA